MYRFNNNSKNEYIINIIALKNLIKNVLNDARNGDGNIIIIKKLSDLAESIFNDLNNLDESDDLEDLDSYEFTPKTNIVEIFSDNEINNKSDNESDNKPKNDSDNESDNKSKNDSDNESNNKSKNNSDNESDNKSKNESLSNSDNKSKNDSDNESDNDSNNNFKISRKILSIEDQLENKLIEYQSKSQLNEFKNMFSDDESSKLEDMYIKIKPNVEEHNINKDKLVDNFLNNTLKLNKYYYLQSFNLKRVNNWNKISNIY